jgi:DNA polymerase III delta subunit
MIDAILDGNAGEAFRQLDRLLVAGENPIALLAQMASSLRRMATAAQYVKFCERNGRRASLPQALDKAGIRKFVMQKSERQLKQVGRHRAARINRWLLEADLALKGSSSAPARARLVLETLITRLSAKARQA